MNDKRIVTVNLGSYHGRVHELDCNWLAGMFEAQTHRRPAADPARYTEMRADKVPAGHPHCRHCQP